MPLIRHEIKTYGPIPNPDHHAHPYAVLAVNPVEPKPSLSGVRFMRSHWSIPTVRVKVECTSHLRNLYRR